MYGARMRFTKNPGASFTTMTVLPSRRPNATVVVTTSAAVSGVTITSSSGILWTGEKKCAPITRSGRFAPAAMLAMGIVLVFVAKIACAGNNGSSSESTACFTARSSNTASMTRGTLPNPVYSTVPDIRESWSSYCWREICRLVSRSFSTSRTAARPRPTCPIVVSLKRTGTPCITETAAMPAPMKPVPSTPSLPIGIGAGPAPATPLSRLSEVVA